MQRTIPDSWAIDLKMLAPFLFLGTKGLNYEKWNTLEVGNKRKLKFIGLLKFLYSILTLKYSKFNHGQILSKTRRIRVDKIHIGCGKLLLKGWLNITFDQREVYGIIKEVKEGTYLLNININKGIPCFDNTVDVIAGAHFIEHLDLNRCIDFAKESFRVLRMGGVIRLSCPDLETYARNYINENKKFFEDKEIKKACTFHTAVTPSQIFAAKAYDCGGAHKWFHDFSSLKQVLSDAGFKSIKKCSRLESIIPEVAELELPQREIETVYIEAIKDK